MAWKCPHCEEEIVHLNYEVATSGSESGTARIAPERQSPTTAFASDYECEDSGSGDWSGNVTHSCPECDRTLEPRELIYIESEEEAEKAILKKEEEDLEECAHTITTPTMGLNRSRFAPKNILEGTMLCKQCKHMYIHDDGRYPQELYTTCPVCGEENSLIEFKELLKSGFFNNINT